MRIGINGMGRIGRGLFRALADHRSLVVAAVNDVASPTSIAHLLRHDSYYGAWDRSPAADGGSLVCGGRAVPFLSGSEPSRIPWGDFGVEWVVEATGRFKDRAVLLGHGRPVLLTAASRSADRQVVFGVNHSAVRPTDRILSGTSCTTHCVVPPLSVLHRAYGARSVLFNTVHCYNVSQTLVDAPRDDLRRARAGALNMIPTTTSASLAVEAVLPELSGRIRAMAVRVPAPAVSLTELVVQAERPPAEAGEVVAALEAAASGELSGILSVTREELVSMDFLGSPFSSIVDAPLTAVQGDLVRTVAWYDNERGYIMRLVDLLGWVEARSREGWKWNAS